MDASHLPRICFLAFTIALGAGCASSSDQRSDGTGESEIQQSSDAALKAKLEDLLEGVSFTSEADYPYLVLEGDVFDGTELTTEVVREKLQAAVKERSSSQRDIRPASCRAESVDVDTVIAEGRAAVVPEDEEDEDYVYAFHDKQLGLALEAMRADLLAVSGFTFGTNESGDQDDVGPVIFLYVGISKSTGKLIAIMTEAVYT